MNTAASRKFFSVAQANQTLPLVKAILQDIVELFRDVEERRERLLRVQRAHGKSKRTSEEADLYREETEQAEAEIEKDEERLLAFVAELEAIGAELKDPRIGLIDFPALHEGREVCLCWKLGESAIEHWHEVDGGFSGRRPITPDFPAPELPAGMDELDDNP